MNTQRQQFFTGIAEMLSQFSDNDLSKMRTMIDNEALSRKQKKAQENKKIIVPPSVISGKKGVIN
jgi:ABC-type transporter MlaC component